MTFKPSLLKNLVERVHGKTKVQRPELEIKSETERAELQKQRYGGAPADALIIKTAAQQEADGKPQNIIYQFNQDIAELMHVIPPKSYHLVADLYDMSETILKKSEVQPVANYAFGPATEIKIEGSAAHKKRIAQERNSSSDFNLVRVIEGMKGITPKVMSLCTELAMSNYDVSQLNHVFDRNDIPATQLKYKGEGRQKKFQPFGEGNELAYSLGLHNGTRNFVYFLSPGAWDEFKNIRKP